MAGKTIKSNIKTDTIINERSMLFYAREIDARASDAKEIETHSYILFFFASLNSNYEYIYIYIYI